MYHPDHAHAEFLCDPEWQRNIVAGVARLAAGAKRASAPPPLSAMRSDSALPRAIADESGDKADDDDVAAAAGQDMAQPSCAGSCKAAGLAAAASAGADNGMAGACKGQDAAAARRQALARRDSAAQHGASCGAQAT